MPTSTLELVTTILGHDGLDLWQFKRLVSQRRRDLLAAFRVKGSGALLANPGIALVHMVHLLNGKQISPVTLVPFLTTLRAHRLLFLGLGNSGTIGRWRFG
jgi:hypothetical protein